MSILATDDFDRADNADLGANWTPVNDGSNGGDNFTIVSNAAKSPNTSDSAELYTALSAYADQWAEATLGGLGPNGVGAGTGVLVRGSSGASFDYYRLVASSEGWSLDEYNAGAHVATLASGSLTFSNGDRIYLEIQGTTLIAKRNTTNGAGGTTLTTQTDATIASGRPGIAHSTDAPDTFISSWQAGDFAGGGTTLTPGAGSVPFTSAPGRLDIRASNQIIIGPA